MRVDDQIELLNQGMQHAVTSRVCDPRRNGRFAVDRRSTFSTLRKDHIEQDPGAPPQRPHIGASAEDFAPPSAPTANTLSARCVFGEPHLGHFGLISLLIERCS